MDVDIQGQVGVCGLVANVRIDVDVKCPEDGLATMNSVCQNQVSLCKSSVSVSMTKSGRSECDLRG